MITTGNTYYTVSYTTRNGLGYSADYTDSGEALERYTELKNKHFVLNLTLSSATTLLADTLPNFKIGSEVHFDKCTKFGTIIEKMEGGYYTVKTGTSELIVVHHAENEMCIGCTTSGRCPFGIKR